MAMSDPAATPRVFTVTPEEGAVRLDLFLVARCPDLSRHQIQQALAAGGVTVDGRSRPKSYRLRAQASVVLTPAPPPPLLAVAQDLPLRIVHADAHLLVIDKEPGRVVHPAPGHRDGTLVNALLHHCRELAGPATRPGIVHRLDRDTSGLLVVALTDEAMRALTAQLRRRELGRVYLALTWAAWRDREGTLEGNIGRSPLHRQRMAVLATGGRTARTHYEVAEDFGFVQLTRARLDTGRTHQIRVHCAHHGHPVVGDPVYGDDGRAKNVHNLDREKALLLVKLAGGRQMLHAAELSLTHPVTGERLVLTAPVPADFAGALALLRGPTG